MLARSAFTASEDLRLAARRSFERAFTETNNELYALWDQAEGLHQYRQTHAPFQRALSG